MSRNATVLEQPELMSQRTTKAAAKAAKPLKKRPAKPEQPVRPRPAESATKPAPHRPTKPLQDLRRPKIATRTPEAVATAADPPKPAQPARPQITRAEGLKILVERANAGNQYCLDGLRQLLEESPEIWQQVGDLARHAEFAWTDLVSGGDQLMLASVKKFVARLKGELAGPAPTPVERLLVEQVVITWLATKYAEIASATAEPSSLGEAKIRLKRAESAQRRHLSSIKSLTDLRGTFLKILEC